MFADIRKKICIQGNNEHSELTNINKIVITYLQENKLVKNRLFEV